MTWENAFQLIYHLLSEIWSTLHFQVMGIYFDTLLLGILFLSIFIWFLKRLFNLNSEGGKGD